MVQKYFISTKLPVVRTSNFGDCSSVISLIGYKTKAVIYISVLKLI